MARKKQEHLPAPAGTENITVDDVYWAGDDGHLEIGGLLREHGYDPEGPLELLLRSIIAKCPSLRSEPEECEVTERRKKREREKRLSLALEALTDRQHPIGRPQSDDYDILLQVAWGYHERSFRGEEKVDLAPIIRECMVAHSSKSPASLGRSNDGENSEVKALARTESGAR